VFRKTVATGRSAVASLQTQLTRLKRTVAGTKTEVQYTDGYTNIPIGSIGGTAYHVVPIMNFAHWARCFGAAAEDETPNDCLIKKTNIDLQLDVKAERDPHDYTFYVVSLTKLGMKELLSVGNPNFNRALIDKQDYIFNGNHGMAFLNKKLFNIHWCRRFQTGGYSSTETQSVMKRWYIKLIHNNGKGIFHKNPTGNWIATANPATASGNMFVLCFNNDSTADASVVINYNAVHTLEV
jgi:hypothetical protein